MTQRKPSPSGRKGSRGKSRAARNIAWIEKHCRIPEGRDVGKPVNLRPWQKAEIKRIYDNPAGTRRAILSFGRKNAKTTLSAFLLLLHLVGPEARPNSQLYSAAQSRDQAAILFSLAAKIVRMSGTLAPVVTIRDTAKQLFCPDLGTLYRALSADASTAYGLSPCFIVHDELGQVRGKRSELYEALETATGAQEDPLSIVISTQAPTAGDLLSILIDDAQTGRDPRVVVSLHTADPELDPFSVEAIKQANPAFGDFLNSKEVLAMAADAREIRSREPEYRNLVLNQRVEMHSPFVSKSVWMACAGEVASDFHSYPVYGGLDLSEVNDLTSLELVACVGDKRHVCSTFWLPEEGLRARSQQDRETYDQWHEDGYLDTTPGATISYQYVARHLRGLFDRLDIRSIAFDRWNFRHFKPWLLEEGFTEEEVETKFIPFGQGFQSMSPALRDLEAAILERRLVHDNNRVLNMCAGNAVVQTDPAGNRKFAKHKSSGRIDGMVALAMAIAASATAEIPAKPPEYQMFIVG